MRPLIICALSVMALLKLSAAEDLLSKPTVTTLDTAIVATTTPAA